jgi:hypothetical protein
LLLDKKYTRAVVEEIEGLLMYNYKVNNVVYVRPLSRPLADQLYRDAYENEHMIDLMDSLTRIFQKEAARKILEEALEVLEDQYVLGDFIMAMG